MTGTKIPGFKLVPKRSHRKWGDKEKVIERFIESFGAKIYETDQLLSPAKLEKIVGKKKIEPFVTREEGVSFVEETDSRQEIIAFQEFIKDSQSVTN